MGGGEEGGWGIFVKILQSHMFYEVYKIRSVIIYRGEGGGVEERFLEVTWFSGEPKGSVVAKRV